MYSRVAVSICIVLAACGKPPDIMTYAEFQTLDFQEPYVLRYCAKSGPGRVMFFGSRHTGEPADSQIRLIEEEIARLNPDIILTESVVPETAGMSRDSVIRRMGESAFTAWLARSKGIPNESVDPPRNAEVEHLLKVGYTVEQLKLFYTLRQVAQSHERFPRSLPVTTHYRVREPRPESVRGRRVIAHRDAGAIIEQAAAALSITDARGMAPGNRIGMA